MLIIYLLVDKVERVFPPYTKDVLTLETFVVVSFVNTFVWI